MCLVILQNYILSFFVNSGVLFCCRYQQWFLTPTTKKQLDLLRSMGDEVKHLLLKIPLEKKCN